MPFCVDSKGVIYKGRENGMKSMEIGPCTADTKARTLEEALDGADCFIGLPPPSVKGAVTKAMVKSMAADPIIFAMANPDPEITPEEVREARLRRHHGDRPVRLSQSGQ